MKNLIVIKIYLNESSSEAYHDLNIENKEQVIKELKKELPSSDVRVVVFNSLCYDIEPFAEIEYTDSLSKKEREVCIKAIKILSIDGELIPNGVEYNLLENTTVNLIKFHKINDEIVVL